MRFAIALAALAAGVIAAPHKHKRELQVVVETVYDYVYVYDVVTVTADDGLVSSSTVLATTSSTTLVTSTSIAPANTVATASNPVLSLFNNFKDLQNQFQSQSQHQSQGGPDRTFSFVPLPVTTSAPPPPPPPAPTVIKSPTSTSIERVTSSPAPPPAPPVAPEPSTTAAVPSSTPSAPSGLTDYSKIALAHHNVHRQNHSAPDLVWDDALTQTALKIAKTCKYEHNTQMDRSTVGGYGQNIAAGVDSTKISRVITDLFYNGEVNYYTNLYGQDSPDMSNFEEWGHFSQIVWRDTTKVGCATFHCESGLANVGKNVPPHFTVCNYQSPGNVAGQYKKVGKSLNHPTVGWDYGL